MEFPLFQAIAAVIAHLGVGPATAARLTGLIFFEVTCALIGILALQWFSRLTALSAVLLFQLTPFAAQYAWASLIEFLATALAVGATVTMNVWLERRRPMLLAGVASLLVVAFLVKPTTAAPWLIPYLVPAGKALQRTTSRKQLRTNLALVGLPPALGLGAGLLWTWHADGIKADNLYTSFLTSDRLRTWNFGSVAERGHLGNWGAIAMRLPALTGGAAVLLVATVIAIVCWRGSWPTVALTLVPIVSVGTFFNLYVVHDYYLCAVYPAVILVVAAALSGLARSTPDRVGMIITGIGVLGVLGMAWVSPQGQLYEANVRSRPVVPALSREISAETSRSAGIVVVGCDWDPTFLYYADRRGLMLRTGEGDADIAHHFADPTDRRLPELPAALVPEPLSYVAYCGEPPAGMEFLPSTVTATPVAPHLWLLTRRGGS
jgi:hypothetical protein